MKEYRYRLEVRISIIKEEREGGQSGDFWRQTQDRLSVEETLDLGAQDFLGVTRILANLHDAVNDLGAASSST